MKLFKYMEFINENIIENDMPTYQNCVDMCSVEDSPFYEAKMVVENYPISLFNYRLANSSDFISRKSREMRGICFVFNEDGSLFKRYVLLEKFFNLNQVPESMYSIVKNYKIKFVSNKEDGSIASFIRMPNGKIVGKSKMGFDNEQANGINRIYRTNEEIRRFVNWTLNNGIIAIFEFVAPTNRIVLRYPKEELILLRLRDDLSGKHIDIKDHLDKIGSIKIAPFEDDFKDLDDLIEVVATQVDKEGCVVSAEDENGRDFFFKLKTPWYCSLHGILSEDVYKENIIIGYILDDKIDDILGQIPEEEVEAHERIAKMILVVKRTISEKVSEIEAAYKEFVRLGSDKKDYAINHRVGNKNFPYVMVMDKGERLRNMSKEEISEVYDNMSDYDKAIERCDVYELAKNYIRDKTKKLNIAREWLNEEDPTILFKDQGEDDIDDN